MSEANVVFTYSPPLLTKDGVFEVASDGRKFITKKNGILTLIDSISLAVIEEFSAYSEAKRVKFSPDSQYICFIDNKVPVTVKIIDIDSKKVYVVDTDQKFLVEYIMWSKNNEFVVFFSELNVYIGVYRIGKDKIILEGPSSDNFKKPLCCFNPDVEYFSVIRHDVLFSYCTQTWEIHSMIKCPVNTIGIIYTDIYNVAIWTSSGKFVVLSLLGKQKFERKSSFSSRIKLAKLCHEDRVLFAATYDDKIELYDVLSWERLYNFEYPSELNNADSVLWNETLTNLQFNEKQIVTDYEFERISSISLSTNKNICDEFKMKSKSKFMLSLSKGNKFLASYTPGYSNVVWIRSLRNGKLAGIVAMNEGVVQGLRWHPTKEILAILTLDSITFWMESQTYGVYCKCILTSFHWVNAKLTICGMATENKCLFLNFSKN